MFSPIWLTYFLSFMLSIITKKFSIDLTDSFKVSWSTLSKCVFNTLFYLLADCFYTVSVQFAPNTFDEILLDCACSLSHLWRVLWFMALLIKTFYQSVTSWRPWIYIYHYDSCIQPKMVVQVPFSFKSTYCCGQMSEICRQALLWSGNHLGSGFFQPLQKWRGLPDCLRLGDPDETGRWP